MHEKTELIWKNVRYLYRAGQKGLYKGLLGELEVRLPNIIDTEFITNR